MTSNSYSVMTSLSSDTRLLSLGSACTPARSIQHLFDMDRMDKHDVAIGMKMGNMNDSRKPPIMATTQRLGSPPEEAPLLGIPAIPAGKD